MKRKKHQGTAVVYFNTIDEKLKPISIDSLQPEQKHYFQQLNKTTQQDILSGKPLSVVDLETEKTVCKFNHENIYLQDWQLEAFARSILPSIQEFFSKEENVKEFEKWKAENGK